MFGNKMRGTSKIIFVLLAFSLPVLADTPISGEIHGFLKADKSPYLVTGNITVPEGNALIIEPGTTLRFEPNTGLEVRGGQLVVVGSEQSPVYFQSAQKDSPQKTWKGIAITGKVPSEMRHVKISNASTGILVENGLLNLWFSEINHSQNRGLYARNSQVSIQDCEFADNANVAVHSGAYSQVLLERSHLTRNKVGLLISDFGKTHIITTQVEQNEVGVVNEKESELIQDNSQVANNKSDFVKNPQILALPPEPLFEGVEKIKPSNLADPKTDWKVTGSIMAGIYNHDVETASNETHFRDIVGNDTIQPHEHYKNIFQTPGEGVEGSLYLLAKDNHGTTAEFTAALRSDTWQKNDWDPLSFHYAFDFRNSLLGQFHNDLTLGDFHLQEDPIAVQGLDLFGGKYILSFSPVAFSVYSGENLPILLEGDRNPHFYNDTIGKEEQQAQRWVSGGSIQLNPKGQIQGTLGMIVSDDELEQPIFAEGGSSSTTLEPMQTAMAVYANTKLQLPANVEFEGQFAVGRADTADVDAQRAINSVFSEAGLSTASFSTLRELMQNISQVYTLTREELESIFKYSSMAETEMEDSLTTLLQTAKRVQETYEDDRDDDRVMGLDWGKENFAAGASLAWHHQKTAFSTRFQYVGEDFYSPGSPDQMADTRELDVSIEQGIQSFWDFKTNYNLTIENADDGADWMDLDEFVQSIDITNLFRLGSHVDVSLDYLFEFQDHNRSTIIHSNDNPILAIESDPWLNPEGTFDSLRWEEFSAVTLDNDTLASGFEERLFTQSIRAGVNIRAYHSTLSLNGRWAFRTDDSRFNNDSLIEKFDLEDSTWAKLGYYFEGSSSFEQTYPISLNTKVGDISNTFGFTPRWKSYHRDAMEEWEWRVKDRIEFPILGRYVVLGLSGEYRKQETQWKETDYTLRNNITGQRFEYYYLNGTGAAVGTNDKNISNELVTENTSIVDEDYTLKADRKKYSEKETDLILALSLRLNHTEKLSSEWTIQKECYDRPDYIANEYEDLYTAIHLYYNF